MSFYSNEFSHITKSLVHFIETLARDPVCINNCSEKFHSFRIPRKSIAYGIYEILKHISRFGSCVELEEKRDYRRLHYFLAIIMNKSFNRCNVMKIANFCCCYEKKSER